MKPHPQPNSLPSDTLFAIFGYKRVETEKRGGKRSRIDQERSISDLEDSANLNTAEK